jgi:hypothetical protein
MRERPLRARGVPGFRFEAEPEWLVPFGLRLSLHPG